MGIAKEVIERGTLVVECEFKDAYGTTMDPDTRFWQLMKRDGTIVNSNSFASNPFTGTSFVISGDDLAIDSDGDRERIVAIRGTYTASYGSGLPFEFEKEFYIKNKYSA